jgi:hypothetical protein
MKIDMNKVTFLTNFWKDMAKRDKVALSEYFQEDAKYYLHDTNEILTANELLEFNCSLESEWQVAVDRIDLLENGQAVIITFHRIASWNGGEGWIGFITSFYTFENDKIIEVNEYYAPCDEISQWRTDLAEHEKLTE